MRQRVFKNHVFPKYKPEDVTKPQMQGFGDPSLPDYSILDFSALLKDEYKGEAFDEEFIRSYVNAAKVLARASREDTVRVEGYAFLSYSYALPVLYLARHGMELALKRAIRKLRGEPGQVHSLDKLYDSLTSRLPPGLVGDDRRATKNMRLFVKTMAKLDPTGFSLRYPKDKNGNYTQDNMLWVHCGMVVDYLEKFVEQLELINVTSEE